MTPRLHTSPHHQDLLTRALPFLAKSPALNSLVLGILARPSRPLDFALTLEDPAGNLHFLAVKNTNRPLALAAADESLLPQILPALAQAHFTEVVGPLPLVRAVALSRSPTPSLKRPLGVYAATTIIPPKRPPPGTLILATQAHTPTLESFLTAFAHKIGEPIPPEELPAHITTGLAENRFHLFVTPAGIPTSLAATSAPTPLGLRLNSVYTPPEHRNQGYAAITVATLTTQLLRHHPTVYLYTDLNNPTPNALYQRLGYHLQGQSAHFSL